MELHPLSIQILIPIVLLFYILLIIKPRNTSKTKISKSNLPPGPPKFPIIGNMHLLAGSVPHHALRNLSRKYGPLMHLRLGEVSTVVVSSSEVAKQVLKTQDLIFCSRPQLLAAKIMSNDCPGIVFAPYGEYWRQLWKICATELLGTKSVQSFKSLREEEFSNLCRWIASREGAKINLTDMVYSNAYGVTARAAFGKKSKEQETFISIIRIATKLAGGFEISDVYPSVKFLPFISGMKSKLEKLRDEADGILESIINEHIELGNGEKGNDCKDKHDLVDVLLKFQDDGVVLPLSIPKVKSVLRDIFSAGSETSATIIDWVMSEMLRNPRVLKKAQDEIRQVFKEKDGVDETYFDKLNYLKAVIKETLRLHPPAPLLLPRETTERCEINGYDIPIKSRVIVNAWAIGRDPKIWEDPEIFIPERFLDCLIDFKGNNFEFIPFGGGRRICPGMSFGLANVELPLAMFLFHFDWDLPNGMKIGELNMEEAFGVTVRRKDDLCVVPKVRRPLPLLIHL